MHSIAIIIQFYRISAYGIQLARLKMLHKQINYGYISVSYNLVRYYCKFSCCV